MSVAASATVRVRAVNSALTSFYIKIRGHYAFERPEVKSKIDKTVARAAAISPEKSVIIDCSSEPFLFLNKNHINNQMPYTWFEYLHELSATAGFPINNITWISGNVHAQESYQQWKQQQGITQSINCIGQTPYWIVRRAIAIHKFMYASVSESHHASMFVGRPALQKPPIIDWYQKNVHRDRLLSSFMQHTSPELPGHVPDLNGAALSGLFGVAVDFTEFEDFDDYDTYQTFKKQHAWWHEDTISEKTIKYCVLRRPFVRIGGPGGISKLQEWGFKTFDGVLFDESYDSIPDYEQRLSHILEQVDQYLAMDFDKLKKIVYTDAVQEIVEHNYNLAYSIYNNKTGNLLPTPE